MSSGKHVPKPHIYLQMYRHLRHRAGIFHENECCLNRCPLCGHWSSVTAVQSSLCMAGYQQPDSSHKNGSWVEDFLQFQAAISSARGLHQLALWGIVTWEQQHLELTKWFKKCTHTCTHACMHSRTHARTHAHTHTHTHTHTLLLYHVSHFKLLNIQAFRISLYVACFLFACFQIVFMFFCFLFFIKPGGRMMEIVFLSVCTRC